MPVVVLLLFRHAPLGVHNAIGRHQPPRRTVLGQVDCFVQCELVGSRPRDTRTPRCGLFQFSGGGAVRIILSSASSSIRALCPNMERRPGWIIAVRLGCLVILLTSSLRTDWCHLIPSIVLKHHLPRASMLHTSTLVIAQHSDPFEKIGIGCKCYTASAQLG